ncbi:hypothetical protein GCM10009668_34130 [Nocardioides dubius]|uniref:Uncharacterized protein n=1 Tax=Nocardioides dubius TaxID=317019 RepID=A0ABP4EM18_9ACTN
MRLALNLDGDAGSGAQLLQVVDQAAVAADDEREVHASQPHRAAGHCPATAARRWKGSRLRGPVEQDRARAVGRLPETHPVRH